MPVTTTSAAIHITPVVLKTFFLHGKRKAKKMKNSQGEDNEVPQDDIFFDEAFHIVKAFIELGTKNTIESLQAFTNTHILTPYWALVYSVMIPLSSCNEAADTLIEWFGTDELKYVVGGERWWQVRGLSGIDAEWVAEQQDVGHGTRKKNINGKKSRSDEVNMSRLEDLDTVMLYVHGGGYSWGSINTHRYQIIHHAQMFKGKVFAVNYRKAPQYPWPCPLQDVISAYFYLIRPPPGALHKAIPNSKIVFAGDSAGGGLCLTVLTVLRDLGLPMPAGAVLISPWVDLTHSFPSVMQNFETDIIPKHGFLAKPSTSWPLPTKSENGGRIVCTVTNEPPQPGKAEPLEPKLRMQERTKGVEQLEYGPGSYVKTQGEMLQSGSETPSSRNDIPGYALNQSTDTQNFFREHNTEEDHIEILEPKPPKILMENPNAVPLELRSQIQMYATTEQLTHPLVSPVLQGSLGNLPPLYILAGDGEVLRDEIVYLAHKAAFPNEYPARAGVLKSSHQKENAAKFRTPTKVHLQLFDGMCHVLTVFMFTKSAKYAYRSIGEFVKHVTKYEQEHIAKNPFSELHQPPEIIPVKIPLDEGLRMNSSELEKTKEGSKMLDNKRRQDSHRPLSSLHVTAPSKTQQSSTSNISIYLENQPVIVQEALETANTPLLSASSDNRTVGVCDDGNDISGVIMIRERVDIHGRVRKMEPVDEIPALQLKASEIGIIKEAPALRWAEGQAKWDKCFERRADRVLKQRIYYKKKADSLVKDAFAQGLIHKSYTLPTTDENHAPSEQRKSKKPLRKKTSLGKIETERRWGPLDLSDERPPASAIAGRRDTPEAVALLKKSIYHTAPVTHLTVPKLSTRHAIRAAFDPNDDPNKPPPQSVSEQQVKAQFIPLHGLRMWDNIVRFIGRKSAAKASEQLHSTTEKLGYKSPSNEV